MSEDRTARLALPLLHAGQAQKELDHNEALALLDMCVQPVVLEDGLNLPPADPAEGDCWIVGADPGGAWSGQAFALAGWTAGGWRFVAPYRGMAARRSSDGVDVRYDGDQWIVGEVRAAALIIAGERVVAARQPAVANPVSGGTIDVEARLGLAEILATLRTHGLIAT